MTKILLTGSSGFVGSNLFDALHQDFELFGLDITKNGKLPENRVYGWDVLSDLPAVDVIIHLAGKAHDTTNTAEEKEYFEVNLNLTQKIFDYFLQSKAKKFIFFSTVKAVADSVEGILNEETTPNPKTAYGKSKLAAEQYINRQPIPDDKLVYILRPCMIHGPGNKGNLNLLYSIVKKGIPWPLGAFQNLRSFTSVENLSYIVVKLIKEQIASGVYQIGDDEPISTNELINLIAKALDRKPKVWSMPKWIILSLTKIGDILKLPLNSERLKKLTESYIVSNQKIKQALQIKNLPISAKDGLLLTLRSFSKDFQK
ncbi:MAG: NAD-dependent epimerase/dehydratase family protein [Bacteroidales bacterium]|jgi:nucleoside-diphosphate-sugar epimerase|nr:NAD-dependent epimerase/dehydratase family protein [Bacteroidales bacterium]MDI9592107.1 NAD-dependent epimerase/dehydratase family protein [Bacteroidota bacterium]NLH33018.1 NAD-dependent epimerase/dehydratase family protein [Lentimicrobium sp.]MBP7874514.1 NAD-dependent epimerase/dehydratase family protein [Bacteroidales bacterium]MCO6467359.1 NAD-dependent epimerase/dehydratase family protein [Bacteroidales bacterium]